MIPVPSGVRVWLTVRHADMRRDMNRLVIQIQQVLHRDAHIGDL
jgi:transposase